MAIEQFNVLQGVQRLLRNFEKSRLQADKSIVVTDPKELMIELHTQWQSFLTAVKLFEPCSQASSIAMKLAMFAIKFSSDFGDISRMKDVFPDIQLDMSVEKTKKKSTKTKIKTK